MWRWQITMSDEVSSVESASFPTSVFSNRANLCHKLKIDPQNDNDSRCDLWNFILWSRHKSPKLLEISCEWQVFPGEPVSFDAKITKLRTWNDVICDLWLLLLFSNQQFCDCFFFCENSVWEIVVFGNNSHFLARKHDSTNFAAIGLANSASFAENSPFSWQ